MEPVRIEVDGISVGSSMKGSGVHVGAKPARIDAGGVRSVAQLGVIEPREPGRTVTHKLSAISPVLHFFNTMK